MKKLTVKKEAERKLKKGYLWVHRNWVRNLDGIKPGEEAEVYSERGVFLGSAYVNPDSLITARIYSHSREPLTRELIKRRLEDAFSLRKKLNINSDAFRIFYSESDGLPGLIIDKYRDVVVFQILTLGLELKREFILQAIEEVLSPQAIVERKDASGRILEGLGKEEPSIVKGAHIIPEGKVVVSENGILFEIDVLKGHKTGHYLDQRENRKRVAELCRGYSVLDCFCNTGGFSIYCAKEGAKDVIAIDISSYMLELALKNAELNGVDNAITFVKGNVFDELRNLEKRGKKFDMVILDPPSFTKSKKTLKNALKGYKEINLRGIKLLKRGGILVTASCSHHVVLDVFLETITSALKDAKREGKILEIRFQAPDHPFLAQMPETLYLKLVIMEIL